LPGWVVSCTATSCSCSSGRPPHSFAPANHKCGNMCPQTGMCSLSIAVWYGMVWYGMVEVCEGAPVAVSGWVLADRHDLRPCAASGMVWYSRPVPFPDNQEPYEIRKLYYYSFCLFSFGYCIIPSHQRPRLAFQKVSPLYWRNLPGGWFISDDPLHGGALGS
jgi:hypothetical protein